MSRRRLDLRLSWAIPITALWIGCAPDGATPSVHEAATRQVRFSLEPTPCLAASPDGRLLATVTEHRDGENRVCLRDLTTGRLLGKGTAAEGRPRFLSFSRDGRRLAVVYDPDLLCKPAFRVQVWDVTRDGQLRNELTVGPDTHTNSRTVFFVAFSPDGKTVVAATADEVLYQWDAGSGRLLRRIQGGVVAGFTPDGRTLLAVSHDGEVRRLDAATGKLLGPVRPGKRSDFGSLPKLVRTCSASHGVNRWSTAA